MTTSSKAYLEKALHNFLFTVKQNYQDDLSGVSDCYKGKTDRDCCSSSNKCGVGGGDCDSDSDCKSGHVCGSNNCRDYNKKADRTADCCMKRGNDVSKKCPKQPENNNFCSNGQNRRLQRGGRLAVQDEVVHMFKFLSFCRAFIQVFFFLMAPQTSYINHINIPSSVYERRLITVAIKRQELMSRNCGLCLVVVFFSQYCQISGAAPYCG